LWGRDVEVDAGDVGMVEQGGSGQGSGVRRALWGSGGGGGRAGDVGEHG
jgi:hypothetical protein